MKVVDAIFSYKLEEILDEEKTKIISFITTSSCYISPFDLMSQREKLRYYGIFYRDNPYNFY